jgi:hypothetical protein
MNDQDQISRIKANAEKVLFKIPGVHGVGIGHKHTKGKYTSELSIKVYVQKKKALAEVPAAEVIPPVIDGIKTDVVETGPPELSANPDTTQYRPARGGSCIKLQSVEQVAGGTLIHVATGTMGCIAKTTGNPSILVGITNQHVLAVDGIFTKGKPIGQSSPEEYSICSKCCSEIIGVVLDGINNLAVDVGVIKLNRKLDYYNQVQDEPTNFLITGTYSLQTSGIPSAPFHVKKRGEKTRLTTGTIDAVSTTFTDQDTNTVTHTGVMAIRPDSGLFSDHGDSGSVVVSADQSAAALAKGADPGKVVGLLFGSNSTSGYGFAFDIDIVKTQLAGINLPINILTASILDNKQTVPDTDVQANAYLVGVDLEDVPAQRAADVKAVSKIQGELLNTPEGQYCFQVFARHQSEVRNLIENNKRVAAVWHRNGGPGVLRAALQTVEIRGQALPTEIQGQPFAERVGRILQAFVKYGSAVLARDCLEFGEVLSDLGGRTYDEILAIVRVPVSSRTSTLAASTVGA